MNYDNLFISPTWKKRTFMFKMLAENVILFPRLENHFQIQTWLTLDDMTSLRILYFVLFAARMVYDPRIFRYSAIFNTRHKKQLCGLAQITIFILIATTPQRVNVSTCLFYPDDSLGICVKPKLTPRAKASYFIELKICQVPVGLAHKKFRS